MFCNRMLPWRQRETCQTIYMVLIPINSFEPMLSLELEIWKLNKLNHVLMKWLHDYKISMNIDLVNICNILSELVLRDRKESIKSTIIRPCWLWKSGYKKPNKSYKVGIVRETHSGSSEEYRKRVSFALIRLIQNPIYCVTWQRSSHPCTYYIIIIISVCKLLIYSSAISIIVRQRTWINFDTVMDFHNTSRACS